MLLLVAINTLTSLLLKQGLLVISGFKINSIIVLFLIVIVAFFRGGGPIVVLDIVVNLAPFLDNLEGPSILAILLLFGLAFSFFF